MMGGPKSTKRVRLSRKVWMNSLISICLRRANILCQPLMEGVSGEKCQHDCENGQWNQFGVQQGDRRTLQEDLLQDGHVIADRKNAGEVLQSDGHLLDGKQKAGQQKCGKKRDEEGDLAGCELILRYH